LGGLNAAEGSKAPIQLQSFSFFIFIFQRGRAHASKARA
jgi:hypothetical protein